MGCGGLFDFFITSSNTFDIIDIKIVSIKAQLIGGVTLNCHDDNKRNEGSHNHSPLKHMLHMVICCGLPMIIIALLPFIAKFSPTAGRILGIISPFICPIMMIGMMGMMFGGKKKASCCENKKEEVDKKFELQQPVE